MQRYRVDVRHAGGDGIQQCAQDARTSFLESHPKLVLRLAIFDGLTHAQIAEAIDMPIGTVKSHVRRGLAAVREKLLGEDSPEEVTQQ